MLAIFSSLVLPVVIIYVIFFLGSFFGIYYLQGESTLIKAFQVSANPFLIIALGVISGLIVILISIISTRLFRVIRELENEFRIILGRLSIFDIVVIAMISSIAEETLFRGLLQPFLGLTITSLIFGLLHFPIKQTLLPWTIFAIGMGFLLGGLYLYTESLITPIIAHCLVNLVNIWRIETSVYQNTGISDYQKI